MTFLVCLLCPRALCYELHTDGQIGKLFPHILNEHLWGSLLQDIIHQWFPFQEQNLKHSLLENAAVLKVPSKWKETRQMSIRLLRVQESLFYGKNEIGMFILEIRRLRDLKPLTQCSWEEGISGYWNARGDGYMPVVTILLLWSTRKC